MSDQTLVGGKRQCFLEIRICFRKSIPGCSAEPNPGCGNDFLKAKNWKKAAYKRKDPGTLPPKAKVPLRRKPTRARQRLLPPRREPGKQKPPIRLPVGGFFPAMAGQAWGLSPGWIIVSVGFLLEVNVNTVIFCNQFG